MSPGSYLVTCIFKFLPLLIYLYRLWSLQCLVINRREPLLSFIIITLNDVTHKQMVSQFCLLLFAGKRLLVFPINKEIYIIYEHQACKHWLLW